MTKAEIAKHIFARNPKVDQLHVTSDGQAFYEKHQAESHSQRLKDRKVESISRDQKKEVKDITVNDPEEVKQFDFLEGNISEVAEVVKTIETKEELIAILMAESEGQNRKGVNQAIDDRIGELNKEQ